MTPFTWALIHSPLVSPFSWSATAEALRRRTHTVLVPDLRDAPGGGPYWQQHADSAAAGLRTAREARFVLAAPLVLAAHSGAGALLPAIRQALGRPVAAYLFVDAVWPGNGLSRLDGFGTPEESAAFRAYLEGGGVFPAWTEEDLRAVVPEPAARARLVRELRPKGLDYWTEPIPAVAGWPDAPGGCLRFTETYRADADRARALGWPVREMAGAHFHMLVEPEAVAEAMLDMMKVFEGIDDGRPTTDDRRRRTTKDEGRKTTSEE